MNIYEYMKKIQQINICVINNKEFTSFEQTFHVNFFLITHNSILFNVVKRRKKI